MKERKKKRRTRRICDEEVKLRVPVPGETNGPLGTNELVVIPGTLVEK